MHLRSKIGVFVAASFLGMPWTAAVGDSGAPPMARPNSGSNAAIRGKDRLMKRTPLTCRIAQVGRAEQKNTLAAYMPYLLRPELLTPTILSNPLIADEVEIQVENTSGGDLEIFTEEVDKLEIFTEGRDKFHFWAETLIRDQEGREITFRSSNFAGLVRSVNCPPNASSLRLKAGQVVKRRLSPWQLLTPEDDLKPGRYTIRARCFYFLARNEKELQFESEPVEVSITTSHIREWSHLRDLHNAMPFVPFIEP